MPRDDKPIRRSSLIGPWGVGAIVPFPNDESLMIAGLDMWRYNEPAPFIIKDERRYFMAQTLFEHEQSTEATVAICKGMDALKAHMEIQDLRQLYFIKTFVFGNQRTHLGADVLGGVVFVLSRVQASLRYSPTRNRSFRSAIVP